MSQVKLLKGLGRRRRLVAVAGAALLAALGVLALAGWGSGDTQPGHGLVVGRLPVPFRPAAAARGIEVVPVTVKAGQRFSIIVDAVDFPDYWIQVGSQPDERIVETAGDFGEGSCPAGYAGCALPYFHALIARSRGTTTMSWRYSAPGCRGFKRAGGLAACPPVTLVVFRISVR